MKRYLFVAAVCFAFCVLVSWLREIGIEWLAGGLIGGAWLSAFAVLVAFGVKKVLGR